MVDSRFLDGMRGVYNMIWGQQPHVIIIFVLSHKSWFISQYQTSLILAYCKIKSRSHIKIISWSDVSLSYPDAQTDGSWFLAIWDGNFGTKLRQVVWKRSPASIFIKERFCSFFWSLNSWQNTRKAHVLQWQFVCGQHLEDKPIHEFGFQLFAMPDGQMGWFFSSSQFFHPKMRPV